MPTRRALAARPLIALPAAAQTAAKPAPKIITVLTSEEFQKIVQYMGFETTRAKDAAGKDSPFFTFRAEGYKVAGFNHNPSYIQLYNAFNDVNPTLESVNIWNQEHSFTRAYVDKEGSAALESDLIVSGGVTQENVEVFIQTFRNVVGKWARFLLDRKK